MFYFLLLQVSLFEWSFLYKSFYAYLVSFSKLFSIYEFENVYYEWYQLRKFTSNFKAPCKKEKLELPEF